MWSMLTRLPKKLMPSIRPKHIRRTSWRVRPWLEVLEDRLVLDAYTFAPNALGDGTSWNDPNNWLNTNNFTNGVPGPTDDAGIPAGFDVIISGSANVKSLTTAAGSSLTITSGSQLTINNNPPGGGPDLLFGFVNDVGRIIANTTDPLNGTNIVFLGGATIGPGDLNGSLDVGPNSSFTFGTSSIAAPNTFAAGATFGLGTGSIIIAAPVSVMGTLEDKTANLEVVSNGDLTGPGSLDEWMNLDWTGGTISLAGGVTVYGSLTSSGAAGENLTTTLTNEETTTLGGPGPLFLGPTGVIDNLAGTMTVSQTIAGFGPGGVTNSPLGLLNITGSTPVVINAPFTNLGNLSVDAGSALDLTSPPSGTGAPTIDLDGIISVGGFLYLGSIATSSTGFNLTNSAGFFEVGDMSNLGTLIVPTGISDIVQGNLEITPFSTLTGGGTVYNSGRLQLDVGSSTMGLGAYVQSNSGTLAIEVSDLASGFFTPLTVTGTAQLSGTLVLPGYDTPMVGDSFTVVTAGALSGHFDSIPDGMVETDTSTTASVTQVSPPA
jgi:hypothetical protein